MKKDLKITKIIIIAIVLILGYGVYRMIYGPIVGLKERIVVKNHVENYLTRTYGDHKFKVTGIKYEYHMETLFDYSNPSGYWVYFKSDVVPRSWVTIDGLINDEYKVKSDHFIEDYYFPKKDGYDIYITMSNMKPKEELERLYLNELREEVDLNIYEVDCNTIILEIPEDYGKIPTLEEIKNNTDLYKVTHFSYKVSTAIEDTKDYEERLKEYIKKNYNCDSSIYFQLDDTSVSVFLDD